jgi:hypothetical protein
MVKQRIESEWMLCQTLNHNSQPIKHEVTKLRIFGEQWL